MTSEKPSSLERSLTWLVVFLTVALLVWGLSQYGLSTAVCVGAKSQRET